MFVCVFVRRDFTGFYCEPEIEARIQHHAEMDSDSSAAELRSKIRDFNIKTRVLNHAFNRWIACNIEKETDKHMELSQEIRLQVKRTELPVFGCLFCDFDVG